MLWQHVDDILCWNVRKAQLRSELGNKNKAEEHTEKSPSEWAILRKEKFSSTLLKSLTGLKN